MGGLRRGRCKGGWRRKINQKEWEVSHIVFYEARLKISERETNIMTENHYIKHSIKY